MFGGPYQRSGKELLLEEESSVASSPSCSYLGFPVSLTHSTRPMPLSEFFNCPRCSSRTRPRRSSIR